LFVDGNQRTGFALAAYYLNISGWRAPAARLPEREVIAFGKGVADGSISDISRISQQLQQWWLGRLEQDA
jgi:hypothetical protein